MCVAICILFHIIITILVIAITNTFHRLCRWLIT